MSHPRRTVLRALSLAGLLLCLSAAPGAAAQGVAVSLVPNPDPASVSRFGWSVALLDIDRDGHLDLVVGAPGGARGRVFVYLGPIPPGVTLTVPDQELVSPQPVDGDRFGASFAVGDVDGDGLDELVIGASMWRSGDDPPTGAAFLYDPDDEQPWTPLHSQQARPTFRMGQTVAIGDFEDAPGLEVALGAPGFRFQAGGPSKGAVHVFSHVKTIPEERLIPNPNPGVGGHDMQFGHRLAAGDWNGNGREDLAVSAIFNDVFVPDLGLHWIAAGQVFVYESPAFSAPAATIDNPDPQTDPFPGPGTPCVYQRFGNWLHFGDGIGGDSFDELTFGAHRKDAQGVCDAGRAYIYSGRTYPSEPLAFIEQEPEDPTVEELFGYNVLFADVIGDGRPDWVVGALSKLKVPYLAVYDAAALHTPGFSGPPDMVVQAPSGHGGHFLESMTAGRLGPPPRPPAIDRDEVILGDPDAASFAGRVAITYW